MCATGRNPEGWGSMRPMVTCWAHELGDCSDTQSREHYVSKGLFRSKAVLVRGLPWCRHETKRIGLDSAASNILCRDHNSRLSPLDAEAARAFSSLREIFELKSRQAQLAPRLWMRRSWTLDARLLERWFLKTFINLTQIQRPIGQWRGASKDQPPIEAVRAVFGLAPIKPPFGLHAAARVDQDVVSDNDALAFAPLHHTADRTLAAGAFAFRGFRFVLGWTDGDLRPLFHTAAFQDPAFTGWHGSDLLQPLKKLVFNFRGSAAQELHLKWRPFRSAGSG